MEMEDLQMNALEEEESEEEESDDESDLYENYDDDSEENDYGELQRQMSGEFSKLPIEVIVEILSRVPVKPLFQCKLVCKPWHNLILRRWLKSTQHTLVIKNKSLSLILENKNLDSGYYMVDHQIFDSLETLTPLTLLPRRKAEIVVGSLDGYLCLYYHRLYVVCNPFTWKLLNFFVSPFDDLTHLVSGFGFDPTTRHYKIVEIVRTNMQLSKAVVYYVGAHYFQRVIADVPYLIMNDLVRCNVFVNGALHWLGYKSAKIYGSMVIVSFDLSSEKFGEIPLPPGFSSVAFSYSYLAVLEDCLCFIDGSDYQRLDVWAMGEYQGKQTWIKRYVLRYVVMGGHRSRACDLIMVTKSGEILLLYDKQFLGYYDPERETFRRILFQGVDSFLCDMFPVLHVESLASVGILKWDQEEN